MGCRKGPIRQTEPEKNGRHRSKRSLVEEFEKTRGPGGDWNPGGRIFSQPEDEASTEGRVTADKGLETSQMCRERKGRRHGEKTYKRASKRHEERAYKKVCGTMLKHKFEPRMHTQDLMETHRCLGA